MVNFVDAKAMDEKIEQLDMIQEINPSHFEGKLIVHIFYQIVKILFTIGTGSLLYPLTVFLYEKWLCDNSFIEGRKLKFIGKLYRAYLIYIVGVVLASLSIFLLNYFIAKIPSFFQIDIIKWGANAFLGATNTLFITSKMRKWKKTNTIFDGSEDTKHSKLERNLINCVLVNAVASIAGTVSLGLFVPMAQKIKAQYFVNLTYICGERLTFAGKALDLYKKLPIWIIFIILTFGLYILYINYYFAVWEIENTLLKTVNVENNTIT